MARCGTRPKMTTLLPTIIAVTQTVVSRPEPAMPVVPKMLARVIKLVEQQASRKTSAVVLTFCV